MTGLIMINVYLLIGLIISIWAFYTIRKTVKSGKASSEMETAFHHNLARMLSMAILLWPIPLARALTPGRKKDGGESMKKMLLAGVVGGLVVFILMGLVGAGYPSIHRVIQTERLDIVAPNGQVQAKLRATLHGPEIVLFDVDGRQRWIIGVDARGASMGFMDQYGESRIAMAIFEDAGVIALTNKAGQVRRLK